MVQENHQEKLKIIIFQYIMLTYFISLNMKDPVRHINPSSYNNQQQQSNPQPSATQQPLKVEDRQVVRND